MATKGYEVLVPELTVHREVATLRSPATGEVIGRQNGRGRVWFQGEVIPPDELSWDYIEALENEDNPIHRHVAAKLRPVSDEPRQSAEARLGVPFAGYDEMDEGAVLAAMGNLPSAAIQRIKEYEAMRDEPRERIVSYNVGFGESPVDRQEGRVSSDVADGDDSKAVRRLKTREVPEEGIVEPGEGITGTGDPIIPHGSSEEGEPKSARAPKRRGRRQRQQGGDSKGDGESGDE
jgi:hypothetical protein